MADRRVVITGLGVVSPLGVGVQSHWASVASARSAVRRHERLSTLGLPIDFAAAVPEEALREYLQWLPKKQLKLYNRATIFAMIASIMAVEEAALQNPLPDPTRMGVILGTLFMTYNLQPFLQHLPEVESDQVPNVIDLGKALKRYMQAINPVDFSLKIIPNLTAGHIAIAFNALGFCRTIADGCQGGLQAVGQASQIIKDGGLDVALCGGAEATLEELVLADLCTMGLLADGGENPEKACRPFDARRNGMVAGEGAGILILEEREHALRRDAKIYGEVLGFGASAGEASIDGVRESLLRSMGRALAEAKDAEVDYIHANGDSTKVHDRAETEAIKEVFGPAAYGIPISATKSMHGHLISASGPVELITCLLALKHGIIPPIINYEEPDAFCDLNYVVNSPRPKPGMKTAVVNAVGFFGESTSLVVRRSDG
ncbi:MAG: beta-ketoacyl-[acyl-carrier-protein] synthase family protein [candidate division NC10 bacterium]|nr:beta-ketoacyl-[acyl-carrier-protein] synthase family protein [candidate division NC10 bacterium]